MREFRRGRTLLGCGQPGVSPDYIADRLETCPPHRQHGCPPLVFPPSRGTVAPVNKTVIEVHVRAVLPTSGGCGVFIGNSDKVFIVYVDQTVGSAIAMFMGVMIKERQL